FANSKGGPGEAVPPSASPGSVPGDDTLDHLLALGVQRHLAVLEFDVHAAGVALELAVEPFAAVARLVVDPPARLGAGGIGERAVGAELERVGRFGAQIHADE